LAGQQQLSGTRPHLLLFGWYRPGTGFTRVLEALVPQLALDYRITWMGVGYRGAAFEWADDVWLEPTDLRGGDMVGAYAARLRWAELAPDIVFALNDLWYLEHYSRELAACLNRVPMVGYLPLDGQLDDPQWVRGLVGYSKLLTYTQVAARDLTRTLRAAENDTPVGCLGHGVDLRRFHPASRLRPVDLADRMQLAQAFFELPEASFVVLNAARADPRKRIDLTLEAFARFAQGRPENLRLCLHQAFAHPDYVEPLRALAIELGISERILWHPRTPGPISDEHLNALYNACAVGINTTAGEGFGLVSFEHAATAAPQILPDQAALCELWGDTAIRLAARPLRTAHSPLLMVEASVEEGAAALARLHDDPDHYRQMAYAALERSQGEDLHWQSIGTELRFQLRRELAK
jgi:glycosyltransferase involved in cell wall biosynthesis